jgi:mono/diheme cytochrome c family protein
MERGRVPRRSAAGAMLAALLVAAVQVTEAATPASRAPAAAANPVAQGEQVYARWCVHCHAAGRGNPGTESLQVKYRGNVPAVLLERSDLTAPAIVQFVRQGVLSMPPFRKTEISDEELAALAAFMTARARGP